MKLKLVGSNQTEVVLDDGSIIFYSYETPVAAYSAESGEYIKTRSWYSVTTSRHINKWLGELNHREVDQDYLNHLSNSTTNSDDSLL